MGTLPASIDHVKGGNDLDDLALSQDHKQSQQTVERRGMESPKTQALSDQIGEWQPFATFTVELQQRQVKGQTEHRTAVSHLEANTGAYWPGIESARLHHWITGQLKPLIQFGG